MVIRAVEIAVKVIKGKFLLITLHRHQWGKIEKTPGKGQVPNAVPLSLLHEVPAQKYFPYPKWDPIQRLHARAMSHQVAPLAS